LKRHNKARRFAKLVRRILQGQIFTQSELDFKALQRAYVRATLLVQVYYAFLLFDFTNLAIGLWRQAAVANTIQPLWPVFWAQAFDGKTVFAAIICCALVADVLAVCLPGKRWVRLFLFVSFLLLDAISNSFGKINHSQHALIAIAFIFIWLPDVAGSEEKISQIKRQLYLRVFWAAQLAFGLFYFMSGSWKIWIGVQQLLAGEINTFHPYALANLVAFRLLQTNQSSILGWLLIEHPLVGWPLHLGVLYLEFFTIIAAFRPSIQRIWGVGLVVFHIGTWLLMEILFGSNMLMIGFLFILSPFAPPQTNWRTLLEQLPLLGEIISWRKYHTASKHSQRFPKLKQVREH